MIAIIGVLFTVATTTGVVVGNVSRGEHERQWIWVEHAHLRFADDVPAELQVRVVEAWDRAAGRGAPFAPGSSVGGEPVPRRGEVLVTLLQTARRPDNLGWTLTNVRETTRSAEWSIIELRPDASTYVIDHELHDHVLGHGHRR